ARDAHGTGWASGSAVDDDRGAHVSHSVEPTRSGVPCHVRLGSVAVASQSNAVDSRRNAGADDGDRTRITSLEGWGSTIALHPHVPVGPVRGQCNGCPMLFEQTGCSAVW